ncbi:hypothetical protein L1887_45352 [Cichorium endivia]|nr:hypothetical protein L1887_45352 [Cichorium endivia]
MHCMTAAWNISCADTSRAQRWQPSAMPERRVKLACVWRRQARAQLTLITGLADARCWIPFPLSPITGQGGVSVHRYRCFPGSRRPWFIAGLHQTQLPCPVSGRAAARNGRSIRSGKLRPSWSGSGRYPERYPGGTRRSGTSLFTVEATMPFRMRKLKRPVRCWPRRNSRCCTSAVA